MHRLSPAFMLFVCALFVGSLFSSYGYANNDTLLTIHPEYSVSSIQPGIATTVHVLVTIKAPPTKVQLQRPPVAVSLVIDRSGSMQDEKKMTYAHRAGEMLVKSLGQDDLFALTIYDDEVEVLYPLSKITNKEALIKQIKAIEPRGYTFLSGGLEKGISQLHNMGKEGPVRVLLLSDGLANRGVTNAEQVAAIGANAKHSGVSVTTIGLGLDFDENLMQLLAQRSGGQYYYIKDSESLPSVLRDELALLEQSFTKNLQVQMVRKDINTDIKIYGYSQTTALKGIQVEMSDFYGDEERQMMIEMRIPATDQKAVDLGTLNFTYTNQEDNKAYTVSVPLQLEVIADATKRAALDKEHAKSIAKVQDETLLLQSDEDYIAAINEMEQGDYTKANEKIDMTLGNLRNRASSNIVIANKVAQLELTQKNMEAAKSNRALQADMVKKGKNTAYLSAKGGKKGLMLQPKDTGFQVEQLQKALKEKGIYQGEITGIYDDTVKEAVTTFQKENNLDADGIAGINTLDALGL